MNNHLRRVYIPVRMNKISVVLKKAAAQAMRVVLLLAFVASTSCQAGGQPKGNCVEGVCIDLQLAEPIPFNQPVEATITVQSDHDTSIGFGIWATNPSAIQIDGQSQWTVELIAGHPVLVKTNVIFVQEGYIRLVANFLEPVAGGAFGSDEIHTLILTTGGTIHPDDFPIWEPTQMNPPTPTLAETSAQLPKTQGFSAQEWLGKCGWNLNPGVSPLDWYSAVIGFDMASSTIELNTSATVTLDFIFKATQDEKPDKPVKVRLGVCGLDPSSQIQGGKEWEVDALPGKRIERSAQILFTATGDFPILVVAFDAKTGRVAGWGAIVYVPGPTPEVTLPPYMPETKSTDTGAVSPEQKVVGSGQPVPSQSLTTMGFI